MITDKQRLDYLLNIYFGSYFADYVSAAVRRAYRDFSRTQHGFRENPNRESIHSKRAEWLVEEISKMLDMDFKDQDEFDAHHKKVMERLMKMSQNEFSYGQAQKWINMSLKYCLVIEPKNSCKNERLFHVPIDNIFLTILAEKGHRFPDIGTWSKINSHRAYMNFQRWIRIEFPSEKPIQVELRLFRR